MNFLYALIIPILVLELIYMLIIENKGITFMDGKGIRQ